MEFFSFYPRSFPLLSEFLLFDSFECLFDFLEAIETSLDLVKDCFFASFYVFNCFCNSYAVVLAC